MAEVVSFKKDGGDAGAGPVLSSLDKGVLRLTLNNPPANALSIALMEALMAELADGFIALPGGLGTIEEFFEALTWAQLGMHQKPCGLLNICSFFDTLIAFVGHMVDQQFVEKEHWEMIQIDESPAKLLTRFDAYRMPKTDKAAWVLEMTEKMKKNDVSQ